MRKARWRPTPPSTSPEPCATHPTATEIGVRIRAAPMRMRCVGANAVGRSWSSPVARGWGTAPFRWPTTTTRCSTTSTLPTRSAPGGTGTPSPFARPPIADGDGGGAGIGGAVAVAIEGEAVGEVHGASLATPTPRSAGRGARCRRGRRRRVFITHQSGAGGGIGHDATSF